MRVKSLRATDVYLPFAAQEPIVPSSVGPNYAD